MPLLSTQNIEAELSYAYIHAVAAVAGMEGQVTGRHLDNAGVDATISAREQFAADSLLTDLSLHVQLKATKKQPTEDSRGRFSYFFAGIDRYDRLRLAQAMPPRVLVVLFLPAEGSDWLQWSAERLVLQRCAYWVSLLGAAESENDTGQTVYLPQAQVFSPAGLRALMTLISRQQRLQYDP